MYKDGYTTEPLSCAYNSDHTVRTWIAGDYEFAMHLEFQIEPGQSVDLVLLGETGVEKAKILIAELQNFVDATEKTLAARTRAVEDLAEKDRKTGYPSLTDQAKLIFQHMTRAGSISARDAMDDYCISSATLARRIVDIERAGFPVTRERRFHPITGRIYTRYSLTGHPQSPAHKAEAQAEAVW